MKFILLIYNEEAPPLQNRYALGNAWFVNDVKWRRVRMRS